MAKINFYKDFSEDEFINDESFQNWVLKSGDEEADAFWNGFLAEYPEKREAIEKAKKALITIPFNEVLNEGVPSETKIRESFQKVSKILGLKGKDRKKATVISISVKWWAAAASVIVILSLGYFFVKNNNSRQLAKVAPPPQSIHDAVPGGNKAILTLGNGETIILDSAANGTLATQGNSTVTKLADGQLAYQPSTHNSQLTTLQFNTISTPRGGQYNLTLPDGSKVWLNAESSLRFPTSFSENERDVTLTGEGYFEVAHNKEKPFHVSVNHTVIEVLGTQFNINAYPDENMLKTTLFRGSVKVVEGSQDALLKPGQQADVDNETNSITIRKSVNLEQVVAWKNGLFQFDNTDIEHVMLQIGRWYDLDVVFKDGLPDKKFTGKIYRDVNASQAFKILEVLGIHFRIEDKKLIVSP